MKKWIIVTISAVIVCGTAIVLLYVFLGQAEEDLPYTPSEEFAPAYEAITDAVRDTTVSDRIIDWGNKGAYDLEETIRILNSLEVAQSQSESFEDFLSYMAHQDYSMVSPEILKIKAKLFPVLEKMYGLQNEYDEMSDSWMIGRCVAVGARSYLENVEGFGLMSLSFDGVSDESEDSPASENALKESALAAFDKYAELKGAKRNLAKRISAIKKEYIDYIAEFAPVYYRYMKEWDKLCLNKDKAYLDIYSGQPYEAMKSVEKLLSQSPMNREGLLLKALCLIDAGKDYDKGQPNPTLPFIGQNEILNTNIPDIEEITNPYYKEAAVTIQTYIENYPSKSAPALLLQGMLQMSLGRPKVAMTYFNQSAVEYPRQAEELSDLLSSYRFRTYVNKSVEGTYLTSLYQSTMEGFGIFSPNFHKAKYYIDQGEFDSSEEEIFKHFFRRGNQGVYDCLLSDMQFCEDFLYGSFSRMVPEKSFIDVSITNSSEGILGLSTSDYNIDVMLINRSDMVLENVRTFLCVHYNDMYKDDYDVIKVPATVNRLEGNYSITIEDIPLNKDRAVCDIVSVRAILMTDDKIFWVDQIEQKEKNVISGLSRKYSQKTSLSEMKNLADLGLNSTSLLSQIKENCTFSEFIEEKVFSSDEITLIVELPRILTLLDPLFSINQIQDIDKCVRPFSYLAGSNIRLEFDYAIAEGETVPLYIYSDFIHFRLDLIRSDGEVKLQKVCTLD